MPTISGNPDYSKIHELASEAGRRLLGDFRSGAAPDLAALECLVDLGLHADAAVARIGTSKLFGEVIEAVCDSFVANDFYDQLFIGILQFARRHDSLARLDHTLSEFGYSGAESLAKRRVGLAGRKLGAGSNIRKAIVLSRVTLGADVAISSVVVSHLLDSFPEAEIVLVGSEKLRELFSGEKRLRVVPLKYGRGAGLGDRLESWLELVAILREEWTESCFVFDPDSRLTQLGMLPIGPPAVDDRAYFFFDGRRAGGTDDRSLSELANSWMQSLLGVEVAKVPMLAIPAGISELADSVAKLVDRPFVTVSLGVGGNARKKLDAVFEARLLSAVLNEVSVVLDCGGSVSELAEAEAQCLEIERQGIPVLRVREGELSGSIGLQSKGVLAWQGGIGSLAAIIGRSKGYIGYDSSGQHLAAALGIPLLVFFRNSGSELFASRWKPNGRGRIQVVPADSISPATFDESVQQFLELIRS